MIIAVFAIACGLMAAFIVELGRTAPGTEWYAVANDLMRAHVRRVMRGLPSREPTPADVQAEIARRRRAK